MAIPPFDEHGLLPQGCHDATLAEIEERLCWNDHRCSLWSDFQQFLQVEYYAKGLSVPLWLDGSFVRDKAMPSDIDVVVDLESLSLTGLAMAMGMRIRHDDIKRTYRVDLWARHPTLPNDLVAFFQYVGDKCALEKSIGPKHPKGILRTQP